MPSDGSMALTAPGAQRAIRTAVKTPVAAADVEPPQALRDSQRIKECFTDEAAPTANAPFIGFAIGEKLFILAHAELRLTINKKLTRVFWSWVFPSGSFLTRAPTPACPAYRGATFLRSFKSSQVRANQLAGGIHFKVKEITFLGKIGAAVDQDRKGIPGRRTADGSGTMCHR